MKIVSDAGTAIAIEVDTMTVAMLLLVIVDFLLLSLVVTIMKTDDDEDGDEGGDNNGVTGEKWLVVVVMVTGTMGTTRQLFAWEHSPPTPMKPCALAYTAS